MIALSTLNPWFVVYREGKRGHTEYFTIGITEDDHATFTERKAFAMLFTNLQSAARVAAAEVGMIRALVTKDEAAEFGRG
jgi:ADP-dependent phosphofructokinase/glucokinase